MLTAVVTLAGDSLVAVRLNSTPETPASTEATHTTVAGAAGHEEATSDHAAAEGDHAAEAGHAPDPGPSPIAPEVKELLWGLGAFVVLALVLRFAIYPRLREGMQARYDSIQKGFTDADSLRDSAKGEVAAYEQALAGVRAEAAARVDAARQTLEGERQGRLTQVSEGIATRKAAATAEVEAARAAAETQVNEAVGNVASRLVEIVTGTAPSAAAVSNAVASVTNAGVR